MQIANEILGTNNKKLLQRKHSNLVLLFMNIL